MQYAVYIQASKKDPPQRCFHTFTTEYKANKYAKSGAKILKAITIVINETGKEIVRHIYLPN